MNASEINETTQYLTFKLEDEIFALGFPRSAKCWITPT